MRTQPRIVLPELLDHLDADDPLALRSRRDLQRIHKAMRTQSTMRRAIEGLALPSPPRSILELGAGDGSLLLGLAREMAPQWPRVQLTLLDRQDLVGADTRAAYASLGWRVEVLVEDVLDWSRVPSPRHYDLCLTSLFLHHFAGVELVDILRAVAARCTAFVACEPRRDRWTLLASRSVALLGANHVTRADAVTSVAAGFTGLELTRAWPAQTSAWTVQESRAFPFTHRFSAMASQDHPGAIPP